jgi:hypothetical protein
MSWLRPSLPGARQAGRADYPAENVGWLGREMPGTPWDGNRNRGRISRRPTVFA